MTAEQEVGFFGISVALAVAFVGPARAVSAQAFLPPAGEGNVTISYQNLRSDGHLDLNGNRMPGASAHDPTQTHALAVEAEVGLSDRLAVSAFLPYIASRYEGTFPHRVLGSGPTQEWDDGLYHGTSQDFHIGARYNVVRRPLAVTPTVEVVIPSHHYPSTAHAAVGKDLRAYVAGAAVAGFLDALLPGLFFQTHVTYAWAQDVLGIRPNRSRVDGELGYFMTPRLSLRLLESYQVTHNGIDLLSFTPMTEGIIHGTDIQISGPYRTNHDRLQRSNYFSLGAGVTLALNDSLEVFVDAGTMVWGENVHPLRAITFGVNRHFSTRPAARP